jgi:hypothetical protein
MIRAPGRGVREEQIDVACTVKQIVPLDVGIVGGDPSYPGFS